MTVRTVTSVAGSFVVGTDGLEESFNGAEFGLCSGPAVRIATEYVGGLGEDEFVRAAFSPGLVGDGEFGFVDASVDVLASRFSHRPHVLRADRVGEEGGQLAAVLAAPGLVESSDRPVTILAFRTGQFDAQRIRGVSSDRLEIDTGQFDRSESRRR